MPKGSIELMEKEFVEGVELRIYILVRKTRMIKMFLVKLYWFVNEIKKRIGLVSQREPYKIGETVMSMDDACIALIPLGYTWDYFAWEDIGEGVSVRKLYENRQIHVRVFRDGEVRMHDEFNYEFEPIRHFNGDTTRIPKQDEIELVKKVLGVY